MKKWGNYWLDLIEFENKIKGHIEKSLAVFIGKRYSSSIKLKVMMTEAIKDSLDTFSSQESLLYLNIDYELSLDYKNDILHGFSIEKVRCK
jgi:hypothetical protein